ncbi:sigma-70 family RNA polymerase sigma factor [Brachybacterium hainanense]|uniref:Sigma-70 family RNA polymerase sigma factor n=1 Tax=Brachybacterium hainanense TaxID=1541174 RepID=A0ABV6R7J2_9MICO
MTRDTSPQVAAREAEEFERHRPRLLAIAARTLGSRADAEDVVQDAWLRLDRHDGPPIEDLGAWLSRVVGRLCVDVLRRRAVRESTVLDIARDPLLTLDSPDAVRAEDPAQAAENADGLGLALLVVLEELRPPERLAFVLHDVFALPFAEVAPIAGTTEGTARAMASRARRRVREQPAPDGPPAQRREVVDAFLRASRRGEFTELLSLLAPDVSWTRITRRGTATGTGREEVLAAIGRDPGPQVRARRIGVDGEPGILVSEASGRPLALMACTVSGGRIRALTSILDPARLQRLELPDGASAPSDDDAAPSSRR